MSEPQIINPFATPETRDQINTICYELEDQPDGSRKIVREIVTLFDGTEYIISRQ